MEFRLKELIDWMRSHSASTALHGAGYVPVGGIIAWSGAISAIPSNWYLCNGSNGTPDLRGRMIVGASVDAGGTNSGASYNKGATGGADDVTLGAANLPAHDHGSGGAHAHNPATGSDRFFVRATAGGALAPPAAGAGWQSIASTDTAAAHTHSSVGSGTAHENRPRFYALAYIMRGA